jgi:hypothetical protein
MTAEMVAQIGYRGLSENKTLVVPGIKNEKSSKGAFIHNFSRFLPAPSSLLFH